MCSKSFLFILACQLVRHDTQACFVVLYFPWNICHAILKKRRGAGYNHGWLLGWFAIWREGILLTTVPLSGMYVLDYSISWQRNILLRMTSHKGYLVYVTSFQVQSFEEQFWGCAKVFKRLISTELSFNSSHCNHRCPHHSHPYHRFTAFSRFDFKSWQMNQNLNGIEIQRALNLR